MRRFCSGAKTESDALTYTNVTLRWHTQCTLAHVPETVSALCEISASPRPRFSSATLARGVATGLQEARSVRPRGTRRPRERICLETRLYLCTRSFVGSRRVRTKGERAASRRMWTRVPLRPPHVESSTRARGVVRQPVSESSNEQDRAARLDGVHGRAAATL